MRATSPFAKEFEALTAACQAGQLTPEVCEERFFQLRVAEIQLREQRRTALSAAQRVTDQQRSDQMLRDIQQVWGPAQ